MTTGAHRANVCYFLARAASTESELVGKCVTNLAHWLTRAIRVDNVFGVKARPAWTGPPARCRRATVQHRSLRVGRGRLATSAARLRQRCAHWKLVGARASTIGRAGAH